MPRDLPVVDPAELSADADGDAHVDRPDDAAGPPAGRVHGAVLAAGTSSRYGDRNKLLEPVDGEPMVVHAVRTLLAADIDRVTVVVGHEAARVRAAVADLEVSVRENPDYAEGQSRSLAVAVEAASEAGADAVLVALGDMPYVSTAAVDRVVAAYRAGAGSAVAAAHEGQRGNPVLFDARHFPALLDVDGDTGGRAILRSHPDAVAVETGDPGVRRDIDRPADR